MRRFTLFGLVAGASCLSACGGTSLSVDEGNDERKEYWQSLPLPPKELIGSWAQTRIISGLNEGDVFAVDEVILVITETGEQYTFDYLGDEYASKSETYENCYSPYNFGSLRREEGDNYLFLIGFGASVSFWSKIVYELNGETLKITELVYEPHFESSAVRSDLTLEDLESMRCSS